MGRTPQRMLEEIIRFFSYKYSNNYLLIYGNQIWAVARREEFFRTSEMDEPSAILAKSILIPIILY